MQPVLIRSLKHFHEKDYFNVFQCVLDLSIAGTYAWLIIFFMVFHAWTNFWGEVTRFGDLRFYSDWWNSGSLGEFWRKWNYPVHNWLIRHVYYPLIRRGCNPEVARILTFSYSAIFHEYIIIGTFRVVNFAAFTLMIINIPIIQLQKTFRDVISKRYNNILFWLCYTAIGQPFAILLCHYQATDISGLIDS